MVQDATGYADKRRKAGIGCGTTHNGAERAHIPHAQRASRIANGRLTEAGSPSGPEKRRGRRGQDKPSGEVERSTRFSKSNWGHTRRICKSRAIAERDVSYGRHPPVRSRGSGNPVFAAKPGSPHPRGRTEVDEPIRYRPIVIAPARRRAGDDIDAPAIVSWNASPKLPSGARVRLGFSPVLISSPGTALHRRNPRVEGVSLCRGMDGRA
jgi:hypothetical protein